MPIKFRCQHCEQFLGIARSRAGAIVDCPQCGRSLRVPNLDGRVRKMPPPTKIVRGDSGLMSALSELATLEDTDAPAPASAAHDISPVRTTPERINVGTIPLERVEDILPPDDFDEDSDAGPFALSESLSELASLSNPANDGPAEEQLLLQQVNSASTALEVTKQVRTRRHVRTDSPLPFIVPMTCATGTTTRTRRQG